MLKPMPMIQPLIEEMELEGATTRRLLQRLPQEHLGWKPHVTFQGLVEMMVEADLARHSVAGR